MKIKGLINKKILEKDQAACKYILNQIVKDKENENLQKAWRSINREKLRMKLLERHENVIQREVSSGMKNIYASISDLNVNSKLQERKNFLTIQSQEGLNTLVINQNSSRWNN